MKSLVNVYGVAVDESRIKFLLQHIDV